MVTLVVILTGREDEGQDDGHVPQPVLEDGYLRGYICRKFIKL